MKITDEKTIELSRTRQVLAIDELQAALHQVHKDVEHSVSLRRERSIAAHNRATNIVTPSFQIGDFVLVRRANERGHKLRFRWYGPCRVTAVHGSLVYGITPLSGGKPDRVHCARLVKYRDSLLGKPVSQKMLDLAETTQAQYEVVDKIVGIQQSHDGIFFKVQWEGLPDKRDHTYHLIDELYADVPVLVTEFLETYKSKKALINKAKHQLCIA